MTIAEEIEKLSMREIEFVDYTAYQEALELYHQLIKDGLMIPRGNQMAALNLPSSVDSVYSNYVCRGIIKSA